jgi:hypothetical protein
MAKRYNIEVIPASTGIEVQVIYITAREMLQALSSMEVGDDIVVHRTEDSDPSEI